MNINQTVHVKLTEDALILMADMDDYFTEAEKRGEWQLWRLMQVFGPHLYMGRPGVFFENNEATFP